MNNQLSLCVFAGNLKGYFFIVKLVLNKRCTNNIFEEDISVFLFHPSLVTQTEIFLYLTFQVIDVKSLEK